MSCLLAVYTKFIIYIYINGDSCPICKNKKVTKKELLMLVCYSSCYLAFIVGMQTYGIEYVAYLPFDLTLCLHVNILILGVTAILCNQTLHLIIYRASSRFCH